jgi:hypothetical protein
MRLETHAQNKSKYRTFNFISTTPPRQYTTNRLVSARVKRERNRIHVKYKVDANERPDVSALFVSTIMMHITGTLTSA